MQFSQTPAGLRSCAPDFGQHTDEVLQEIAGCSGKDISKLRELRVI